ncbi:MAG: hypothetical protein ACM3IJ_01205 [Candidatus Levyibacteriota bacterium]
MYIWAIFLIEIFVIFLTSRAIFQSFFVIFYLLFRSEKMSITLLSIFFFPGVIVHELSHLLTAEILGVKTHGIYLVPEYRNGRLKMGSVLVDHSDFIRQFFIGVAPLFTGLWLLSSICYLLFTHLDFAMVLHSPFMMVMLLLASYLTFAVTNTMFSSKKDMDGALELFIVIGIVFTVVYFLNFHLEQYFINLIQIPQILEIIKQTTILFSIPLGFNLTTVFLASTILKKRGVRI